MTLSTENSSNDNSSTTENNDKELFSFKKKPFKLLRVWQISLFIPWIKNKIIIILWGYISGLCHIWIQGITHHAWYIANFKTKLVFVIQPTVNIDKGCCWASKLYNTKSKHESLVSFVLYMLVDGLMLAKERLLQHWSQV